MVRQTKFSRYKVKAKQNMNALQLEVTSYALTPVKTERRDFGRLTPSFQLDWNANEYASQSQRLLPDWLHG